MCDLIVALADSTKENKLLFGKNSDRPAGECQVWYYGEARKPSPGREIQCSYVSVPDEAETLATLGCRPYWCWGYETGINEAGVVGGNAAIFTKSLHIEENRDQLGLTGMDLLRFGLERGRTAEETLDAIVILLEKYGQWGSAVRGTDHNAGSYDNSYLLADAKEAWVLETSGKRWIAENVKSGVRSISNQPTIRSGYTKAGADIEKFAVNNGWWSNEGDFDFAFAYGDHRHYSRQVSHIRWRRTNQLLQENKGRHDPAFFKRILRDHYEGTFIEGPQFHQYLPDFHTLCMHDSPNKFTWGNTATSVVVELDPKGEVPPMIWFAYVSPCSSVFTAIPFTANLPQLITNTGTAELGVHKPDTAPVDTFSQSSLWWRLNRLLEKTAERPAERYPKLRQEFDAAEEESDKLLKDMPQTDPENRPEWWNNTVRTQIDHITTALNALEKEWRLT